VNLRTSLIPSSRTLASTIALLAFAISIAYAQTGDSWHEPVKHDVQFVTVDQGVRLEIADLEDDLRQPAACNRRIHEFENGARLRRQNVACIFEVCHAALEPTWSGLNLIYARAAGDCCDLGRSGGHVATADVRRDT
jgi:hypothetical protein